MTRRIVLLRGINLGGNRLPMPEFRALLEAMGLTRVQTYIASGNAVFEGGGAAGPLADAISAAIARDHGFSPAALVLSADEMAEALAASPFPQAEAEPKTLHLFFLRGTPSLDEAGLRAACEDGEAFALGDQVFYFHTPGGFGRSKAAGRIDRYLKAETVTARNLNTCRKLLDLARG